MNQLKPIFHDTLNTLFPWTDATYRKVTGLYTEGRLPHALLLEGAAGIGKQYLATAIASRVFCQQAESSESLPCGVCKTCLLRLSHTHPDFKLIAPEEGSRVIKVDAVRQLVEFVSQSSMQGGYKVAVVSPADSLNHNSANALLKTLEEPTPNTLIILVTSQSGFLLPTIRSRCQAVLVPAPSAEQSEAWLHTRSQLDSGSAHAKELLAASFGSPLKALVLLEAEMEREPQRMIEHLSQVLKRKLSVSEVAEQWADDHAAMRVEWLESWAQSLIKYAMLKDASLFTIESSQKMFQYIGDKTSPSVLFELQAYLREQWSLLQGVSNPDKQLLFESILIRWQRLMLKSSQAAA